MKTYYYRKPDLPAHEILEARKMLAEGKGLSEIADRFGVMPSEVDLSLWRNLGNKLDD